MTITIELTQEQEALVKQEAARRGEEPMDFVRGLLLRNLQPAPTLTELLAPFRQQVEQSGITDAELGDLIEEARQEVFLERRASVQ